MCLIETKNNDKFKITNIYGGQGVLKRLRDLGLITGEIITVIKNDRGGPILINLKGSMIALGRGIAQKIFGEKV